MPTEHLPITVAFMGDSITHGQYVEPPNRWTDLAEERAFKYFEGTDVHLRFFNRGVPGETSRLGLQRFAADIQSVSPHIMTLQFGLNDCNCWETDRGLPRVSELSYRANMIEMVERARHFGAQQIIIATNHCTLRHKKLLNGQSLEGGNRRYNQIAREVAAETDSVLCDIEHVFIKLSRDELAEMLLPDPDLLHLSIPGHRVYADQIFTYLQKSLTNILLDLGIDIRRSA